MCAYINNVRESTKCPVEVFLELKKWEFSCWNKDLWINQVHNIDNFIVLDIIYTIKWADWNDTLKKYTSKYFSNEVRKFDEDLYLIKMDFDNWVNNKELVLKWKWKNDIKPNIQKWVALNMWLIILDLNDLLVKEVFVSWNNFFKVSNFIRNVPVHTKLKFTSTKMYSNWALDKNWNEVLVDESFVDTLKWSEAVKYKARYILDIVSLWNIYNEVDKLFDIIKGLDEYYEERKKYYSNTYWGWYNIQELEQDSKLKLPEEPKKTFIQNDISVEDLPF